MNSVRTSNAGRRPLIALVILTLSLILTACSVDTIPEWIAGQIIREIIARDYDLIYGYGDEETEVEDDGNHPWETGDEPEESAVSGADRTASEETDSSADEAEDDGAEDDGGEEDLSAMEDDERAYYFSTLESPEKKLYLEVYNAIFSMEDDVTLSSKDADQVDRIFNLCMMDHPELFFCDGYKTTVTTRDEETVSISFSGKYNVSKDERKEKEDEIKSVAEEVLKNAPDDESDYEKAKYVFEWIIDNTEYDVSAPDNQNISSVFLNKRSVCQGYTMATKYLLDRLGIFCTIVYGTAANESHAWNLARLDGTYCYIDTTWGDSSYREADNSEANRTSYNYFGCNSEILLRTHTIAEKAEIPECTSLDEYYYVKEAKYFTKFDNERLKAVFDHEAELGEHMFTIRASSEDVYNELYEKLFTEREIFNLIPDADKVTYIEDKAEYTLTFSV